MRPPEHLKDLAEIVSSRLVGNPIHIDYRVDYLRVTSDSVFVPITLQIPNREMAYREKNGVQSATLNVYAQITTVSGRVVQTFEEAISRDVPAAHFQKAIEQSSIFQKAVPLRPGLYKLDVVVKDVESGNVAVIGTALRVLASMTTRWARARSSSQIRLSPFRLDGLVLARSCLAPTRFAPAFPTNFLQRKISGSSYRSTTCGPMKRCISRTSS